MKKVIYYSLMLILVFAQYSCTDQSTFNNPAHYQLEKGAFVKFEGAGVLATYDDAQNISISEEIIDANDNISEYSLNLLATVSGSDYVMEDFIVINDFPATLNISSQSMADALGLSVDDFGFGDEFKFIATATRNDGVEFYGVAPTFDKSNLTIGVGNTESQLYTPAYKNAMNFGTIVSCPFTQADMVGTYTIVSDDGFSAAGNTGFEIIAGAKPNEIVLVNPFGSAGNFNITIKVNPDTGIAEFSRQNGVLTEEICCAGYTPTSFRSNSTVSLALSCVGLLSLNFDTFLGLPGSNGTGYTFGPGKLVAQKN